MTVAARQESWRLVTSDGDSTIDLQPLQGLWTEAQYLRLTGGRRRLIEFADGTLEILSMPTDRHQVIVRHLFLTLFPRATDLGGTVLSRRCACASERASSASRTWWSCSTPATRGAETISGRAPTWSWR